MEGALFALIIVAPIASLIGCYQCFNHGRMPCIDASTIDNRGQVIPEN
jgi:hypothetical protein